MEPSCSPTCELFEASLSTLIDGELEVPEQLPAVDHLLRCASCRDFYRRARALGGMVTYATKRSTESAPPEVWERIATDSGLVQGSPPESSGGTPSIAPWLRGRRYLAGVAGLAAALVAATGLWLSRPAVVGTPVPGAAGETGVVDVVLEQDRGSMSDERFLELTTELLRADRGYHRKMLEIMSVVADMAARPEGSGDEPAVTARDRLRRGADGEGDGEDALLWSGDRL